MKTGLSSIALLLIFAGMILSCSRGESTALWDSAEQREIRSAIGEKLAAGHTFAQADPFIMREFLPFPDGESGGRAVAYGCYRSGQAPGQAAPADSEILADLNIITEHWDLIRVYNADDVTDRILALISMHKLPLRVLLGVWLTGEEANLESRQANITNTLRCLELAGKYPELIAAINTGNETQVYWSGHRMQPQNLIRYIRAIRNNTTVPVTTADDYNFWNKPESEAVAAEVDFIVTHIHPLWNGKKLDRAIEWLEQTFREVQHLHPGKSVILGEVGWATRYNADKTGPGEQGTLIKGEVSLGAQGQFLILLEEWLNRSGVTAFLFEAFDEPWKGGGEASGSSEVEQNWGVFYENRTPKESFRQFLTYKLELVRDN